MNRNFTKLVRTGMKGVGILAAILAGGLLTLLTSCMSAPAATNSFGLYQIECAGPTSQGSQLVKVWIYSSSRNSSIDLFKRYAVHGVIFKGYAGGNGCTPQSPMAANPALEMQRATFFEPFFNTDRAYNKYASQVGNAIEQAGSGKNRKIGAVISVSKDMLRRDLEAAGVLNGLSGGF